MQNAQVLRHRNRRIRHFFLFFIRMSLFYKAYRAKRAEPEPDMLA